VPGEFVYRFARDPAVLKTHRGYDPGANNLFKHLQDLASFSKSQMESRLLIEMNRSLHHPDLFSIYTRPLPTEIKNKIIEKYYLPYRNEIETAISGLIETGEKIIHLSIHSFTPELDGKLRNADIGLLYDPARQDEKEFCKKMKRELQHMNDSLRIKANYPYLGTSDGFTTSLRKKFLINYIGIEIEVNQRFVIANKMDQHLKKYIFSCVEKLIKI